MPESDKKIKHFIFMRFFPTQIPEYPYDVLDMNFLFSQLVLAKNNALKSLENQTNKNFEVIFLVHEKFLSDAKYKFIFSTLKKSTSLPIKFIRVAEQAHLIGAALEEYDFVIQSRMDFDDFIFKDAITDTQSKIDACDKVLAYGYCSGFEYINGELYINKFLCNGTGHISILQSLVLKSSFAKELPPMTAYYSNHTKVKLKLKKILEENGCAFSEDMFQQNTSTLAYIYFRHEFSLDQLRTLDNTRFLTADKLRLTGNDTLKQWLQDNFCFHYELNSIH